MDSKLSGIDIPLKYIWGSPTCGVEHLLLKIQHIEAVFNTVKFYALLVMARGERGMLANDVQVFCKTWLLAPLFWSKIGWIIAKSGRCFINHVLVPFASQE